MMDLASLHSFAYKAVQYSAAEISGVWKLITNHLLPNDRWPGVICYSRQATAMKA